MAPGRATEAVPGREVEPPMAVPVTVDELESSRRTQHLAEVEHDEVDAALEATIRTWELPELGLLDDAPASSAAQLDLTAKGQRIRETLAHFGIGVKVARIQEGPVVTQYALDVEPGIKLSRIEGLADNLALDLRRAASGSRRRSPASRTSGSRSPTRLDLVTLKEVLSSPTSTGIASAASSPSRWAGT